MSGSSWLRRKSWQAAAHQQASRTKESSGETPVTPSSADSPPPVTPEKQQAKPAQPKSGALFEILSEGSAASQSASTPPRTRPVPLSQLGRQFTWTSLTPASPQLRHTSMVIEDSMSWVEISVVVFAVLGVIEAAFTRGTPLPPTPFAALFLLNLYMRIQFSRDEKESEKAAAAAACHGW